MVAFLLVCLSSYMTRFCKNILMGFSTKIQLIKRAKSEQWYINFPSALAQAMEFDKAEVVEWIVQDKHCLTLKRTEASSKSNKKKPETNG